MQIGNDSWISFHYELKNDEGQVLDRSGDEPLNCVLGYEQLIPGLEAALQGRSAGDSFVVTVEPAEAYGEHDATAVQQVSITAFEDMDDLEEGMQVYAFAAEGMVPVRIVAIEDGVVTVDANHELAGERLHFTVTITETRPATAEERAELQG